MKKLIALMLILSLSAIAHANCGNGNGNGNGCSGGDGGSVGPAGPQGPAGANGTNGVNGKDGVNAISGPSRSLQGELDVRLWDTKHTSFMVFDSYGFDDSPNHDVMLDGRNSTYGVKLMVKLGSSYEERLLEAQAQQIKALQAALRK